MKINLIKIFFILSIINSIYGQELFIGDSYRIYPSDVTQTEPVVSVSPINSLILFASAVTINTNSGFKSEGVYISTNGGLNWFGSDTCNGENIFNHGGDPGVVIDKNGVFILTHIGSIFYGMYSHYSLNSGANWSTAYSIITQQTEDKSSTTTDVIPTSPYYGRTYISFVRFVSPFPVMVSYTTNSGISWTTPQAINNPPPSRCSGGYVIVGMNGRVLLCWAGVNNVIPYTEDFIGFAYSDDGGVNWNLNQNIFDVNGINGTLPSKSNIRVNGLPRMDIDLSGGIRNGWIYIVTTEKNLPPAGSDPDIILRYSSNDGLSWSSGIRVNQDPLNNGKIQYFPAIKVDNTGAINIIFYDDRNTSSDSAEVYLARSTNGGSTWSEYCISGHRFKPKPITGGPSSYQGDFISLEFTNNKLIPLWMDDYSGIYQIWTVPIDIGTFLVKENHLNSPEDIVIKKCYPNPFNNSIKISYSVNQSRYYFIEVFDIAGKKIDVITEGFITPGNYNVYWNAQDFPSGIYFLRISSSEYSVATKIVLLK